MNKTFSFITNVLAVLFVIIAANLAYIKIINLNKEVDRLSANNKAYVEELDSLSNRILEQTLTVEELNSSKDSLIKKLIEEKNKLKIKDKNLKELQYLLSTAKKTDTLKIVDTLFKDPDLNIDTLLGDDWYTIRLKMQYPGTVVSNVSCISEKYIISHYKKETVRPPKRFFISRWFQKRHKIVEVEVIEKNPYIDNTRQKFIEILD